jgi:hypothetical protein
VRIVRKRGFSLPEGALPGGGDGDEEYKIATRLH